MDLDTTDTARGLLMLRPIPTFFTEDTTIWTWTRILRPWTWILQIRQEVC